MSSIIPLLDEMEVDGALEDGVVVPLEEQPGRRIRLAKTRIASSKNTFFIFNPFF